MLFAEPFKAVTPLIPPDTNHSGLNGLSCAFTFPNSSSNPANNILGGKVSGGVWLNKIIGLRVDAEAGNVWLKGGYNAVTVGAGADILVNLMKNYTDEDRKFRLNAIFGLGYNYYSFGTDFDSRFSKDAQMRIQPESSLQREVTAHGIRL